MIRQVNYSRKKRVVVDVDTQKCFFSHNGKACVHNSKAVLANIRRVIAWTRQKHICVISTKQVPVCHYNFQRRNTNGLEKVRWTLRNRRTQFDATDCTDLPSDIFERYDQVIFCKRCVDPFEEPRVDRMLTELEAGEFILIGSLAEGAIKATALGLLARRKNVRVLVDAIGTCNAKAEERALRNMRAKGAKLSDTETLMNSSAVRLVRNR